MKYWNYRVMRRKWVNDYYTHSIHEVYYNNKGRATLWSQDPLPPIGDSLKELKRDIKFYKQALDKPVLDFKTGKEIKEKE